METPEPPKVVPLDPKRPTLAPASPSSQQKLALVLRQLLAMVESGHCTGIALIARIGEQRGFQHQVVGEMPSLETIGAIEVMKQDIIVDLLRTNFNAKR